jgi:lipid-A-disaccharide synthase
LRIFFSAGEASGDRYAAAIVREISKLTDQVHFEGIGGNTLRETGASLIVDSGAWGAVSISESLKVGYRVLKGGRKAKRALAQGEPGLFIPIDFGFFNIKLARYAKSIGWKVLYFIPPGSWRRDRQGRDIPVVSDAIVTPFSWSADILNEMGGKAHWFGHPLKQIILDTSASQPERNGIAVLPGSRKHEIELHVPLVAQALDGNDLPVEFALAPTVDRQAFEAKWRSLAPHRTNDRFTVSDTYGVLKRAQAAFVCSGTATLEAALCGCPTVVIYKLSRMMAIEYAIIRPKIPFASLPNILLQRMAVPELLHYFATPQNLRDEMTKLLTQPEVRDAQLAAFAEINELLGASDAITQSAHLAVELMGEIPQCP